MSEKIIFEVVHWLILTLAFILFAKQESLIGMMLVYIASRIEFLLKDIIK